MLDKFFSSITTTSALLCFFVATAGMAQEQLAPSEAPPPLSSSGRPEYATKKLPNETFKPSEKISEDFPVPFPVDI